MKRHYLQEQITPTTWELVLGIAPIFVVDFAHFVRPMIDQNQIFYSIVGRYIMKHFPG